MAVASDDLGGEVRDVADTPRALGVDRDRVVQGVLEPSGTRVHARRDHFFSAGLGVLNAAYALQTSLVGPSIRNWPS